MALPNPQHISPTHGPKAGGTTFSLTGTDLADSFGSNPPVVTFDNGSHQANASLTAWSDTQIRGTTPAVPSGGSYDVIVTTDAGSGTLKPGFLYDG